jgi:hypothetical protein
MGRRIALATFAAALLVAAAAWFVPFAREPRLGTAGVPQPPPFHEITPVELRPRARMCVAPVDLSPQSAQAQLVTDGLKQPGPPLRLEVTGSAGSGYRAAGRLAGGYADGGLLIPFRPPPRETRGTVCVTNAGRSPVAFVGSAEPRTAGRTLTTIGRRVIEAKVALTLNEERTRSLFGRRTEIAERIAAFKPFGSWLVWPLGALVALGLPGAIGWALWWSLRRDERRERSAR